MNLHDKSCDPAGCLPDRQVGLLIDVPLQNGPQACAGLGEKGTSPERKLQSKIGAELARGRGVRSSGPALLG